MRKLEIDIMNHKPGFIVSDDPITLVSNALPVQIPCN